MNESTQKTDHGEQLGCVALCYDDLEKIVAIFRDASQSIIICYNGEEFSNLEEITLIGEKLEAKLEIKTLDPHISLQFFQLGIWLSINEKSPIQVRTFNRIKEFLKDRSFKLVRPKIGPAMEKIGAIAIIAFTFGAQWLKDKVSEGMLYFLAWLALLPCLLVVWLWLSGGDPDEDLNYIYTNRKRKFPDPNTKFVKGFFIMLILSIVIVILARNYGLIDKILN